MIDYIACILVRALNKILGFVPISASLWLGRRIGTIAFMVNKKRRLIAYANLKAAFAKEKSPAELRCITKRIYQNLVQTFVEILNLTKVNHRYVDKYVEVVNMDRIRNASKSGRGTILLTAHFGDWEMSSLVSSVEGFPILVLAREQKMKRMNELLNTLRESNGCKVIRKGMSTKNILKALYDKNIVGILSDQDAGRNGTFVNFFGRPTSCHSGPMEIAKHTDSIVLPNFIVRTKGPYHKLHLEEYIDFRNTNSPDDIKQNLQKFATLLESYVRIYPDQWLWLHKRWKSTPTRTVLVMNDGRAGHLNQSLAVAEQIKRARATQGFAIEDTKVVVVDVKFKSPLSRILLSLSACIATWRCHGRMRSMKFCLAKDSYETLMRTYSEFVVSCGSSLAAVNIFMSKENNAKNIVVMKPGAPLGLGKFNLAIIPRHDNPPKAKNVVATEMAPNLISGEKLKDDSEKLKVRVRLEKDKVIGLFVGGDNSEFSIPGDLIKGLIDSLAGFSAKYGADMLITTSRRTSDEAEGMLKNRLANEPRCKLLVIANEDNPKETVGGIMGLSDIIIVSEESVSMISEAVSSGKKVVVFKLIKKASGPTKYETIVSGLEREGHITVSTVEGLASVLEGELKKEKPVRKLQDNDKILEAVRRLV